MNGPVRPANQTNSFALVARNRNASQKKFASASSKVNATPKENSSKAAVQTPVIDQPEPYENEFPAMPEKGPKPVMTKQTLKITPAVPQEFAKISVLTKGKNAKKVSEHVTEGEKSTLEGGSDSNSTSKKINVEVSDNAEGKSTPNGSSVPNSTSKKIAEKTPINAEKKEEEGRPSKSSEQLSPIPGAGVKDASGKKAKSKDVESKIVESKVVELKDVAITQSTTEMIQTPLATSIKQEGILHIEGSSTEHEDASQPQESFNDGQSSEDPSHLEENYPVTPQCVGSTQPLHVQDVTETPINVDSETPSKQLDDPLSWVAGNLTGPADFEGRPRRQSLPYDTYRSPGLFGDLPPSLIRRARGQSLRSRLSEQEDDGSERSPSTVPEESPVLKTSQPSNDTTSPKKVIVVTVHPDSSFTVSPPMVDTSSHAHSAAPSMYQGLQLPSTMNGSGSMQVQVSPDGYPLDHPFNARNLAPDSHGYLPGFTPAATPFAGGLTQNGLTGHGPQPTTATVVNPTGPQETYSCTYCNAKIAPTLKNPLVFCSGCGPTPSCTYCSIACLLVDSYDHATSCWNYPAAARAIPHTFPPGSPYVYETNPVMTENMGSGTREQFRQRTFLLYARYGPWPNLAEAWCRKNTDWPRVTATQPLSPTQRTEWRDTLIDWETQKRTGVYHIFWSGAFESSLRANPKADVIYVSLLRPSLFEMLI